MLSIGRVQTPTLALIVERQHEINKFTSEVYYELKTKYRDVLFAADLGKIPKKEKGQELMASIKASNFEIVSYTQKEGKESPQFLYDLTPIQVECNKKCAYPAEQPLNIVQKLYEIN